MYTSRAKRRRERLKYKQELHKMKLKDSKEIDQLKRKARLNKAKCKAYKEPWTYTKYIVFMIIFIWVIVLGFCTIYWAFTQVWENEIMNSVSVVAVPTILSYAVKSGFEYKTKFNIQSGDTNVTSASEDSTETFDSTETTL